MVIRDFSLQFPALLDMELYQEKVTKSTQYLLPWHLEFLHSAFIAVQAPSITVQNASLFCTVKKWLSNPTSILWQLTKLLCNLSLFTALYTAVMVPLHVQYCFFPVHEHFDDITFTRRVDSSSREYSRSRSPSLLAPLTLRSNTTVLK